MARFPASGRFRRVRVDERWSRYPAFPEQLENQRATRSYAENRAVWDEHTVLSQLYRVVPFTDANREVASTKARPVDYGLQPGQLAIVIDCGTEDYFFEVNRQLHEQMLYYHISHDYIVRPGQHTHDYWRSAVEYHLFFFGVFRYATEPVGRAYLNSSALYSGCLSR